jgi:hypothetical protein
MNLPIRKHCIGYHGYFVVSNFFLKKILANAEKYGKIAPQGEQNA